MKTERPARKARRELKEALRKDKGLAKAANEIAMENAKKNRMRMCKDAIYAAQQNRDEIEKAIALGTGVKPWIELEFLSPPEITVVMQQLVRMWGIRLASDHPWFVSSGIVSEADAFKPEKILKAMKEDQHVKGTAFSIPSIPQNKVVLH